MITTKKVAKWLWAEILKESTIQKPSAEQVRARKAAEKAKKAARRGDAVKGVLLLIIAPIIGFILCLLIGI